MISTAPILERLKSALRALLGEARTDHHRYRVLGHDLLEKRQPIHARHLDIQGDDIRHLFADTLSRHEGVGRGAYDLDFRVGGEDFAQGLSHHCGVVHDKNANFGVLICSVLLLHQCLGEFTRPWPALSIRPRLFFESPPGTASGAVLHRSRCRTECFGRNSLPGLMRSP